MTPPDWLVVGLGNPGRRYAGTRHNAGYLVMDELLVRHDGTLRRVRGIPAKIYRTDIRTGDALLLRSTTFMNESGLAVAPLAERYGIPASRIVVIHDELDLPPGKVRIRVGGSENGHNGLKSVSAELGTRDYVRVRVGIGRPPTGVPVIDHVMEPMDAASGPLPTASVPVAADAVELIVDRGVAVAQNEIHRR